MLSWLINEPASNVGKICKKHGRLRLRQWQKLNSGLVLRVGDYVKISFSRSRSVEWMWVKITAIDGTRLTGELANDPVFVDFKNGDIVMFSRSRIADYTSKAEYRRQR